MAVNYNSGITLHKGQQTIYDNIEKNQLNGCVHHVIVCSRQFGKSFFFRNLLLKEGLNNVDYNCLWFSPTYSQAVKVFDEVISELEKMEEFYGKGAVIRQINKKYCYIKLYNKTYLRFFGSDRIENCRGFSADRIFVDEAAFCKDELPVVVRPMIAAKIGAQMFYVSTPNGTNNFFHSYYQRGLDPDDYYYSTYIGHYSENPFYNVKEVEDAKKSMTMAKYMQEYENSFISSAGMLFSNVEDALTIKGWSRPYSTKRYFFGVDLANKKDFSVITVLDQDRNVVLIERYTKISWREIMDKLVKVMKDYNAIGYLEVNSIGSVIFEELKLEYSKIKEFSTQTKSKAELVHRLIFAFENKLIKIPDKNLFPHLYNELTTYEVKFNPQTRNYSYNAATGCNDDTVISLGLANLAYERYCKSNNDVRKKVFRTRIM